MMKSKCNFGSALLTIMLGLLLVSISGMAQKNTDNNGLNDSCLLQSFTVRYVEGNMYINWTAISNILHFYFTVERSIDGKPYEIIDVKKGFFSPKSQPLLYCYIDSVCSHVAKVEYRLRAFKMHYEVINNEPLPIFYSSEPTILERNVSAEIEIIPLFSFFMSDGLRILSEEKKN